MSIFEDLIEELKEENLLEETVIEFHQEKSRVAGNKSPQSQMPLLPNNEAGVLQPGFPADETIYSADEVISNEGAIVLENSDVVLSPMDSGPVKKYPKVEKTTIFVSEKEYFRKRAIDEVSGLQMVDHMLSGVEREQMKLVPTPYDDLPVKLALHDFLQIAHESNSTEHAQAEFRLMQETENWCSALSHRDKHISIANLRRHCETTRPPLSAQALISLARFYRNSPYSEPVRSKFELVITRLFSREEENDQRSLLLSREEIMQQLKELYADWSSIQLYSSSNEDSEILIAVLKFEDFMSEAENTENFEELIKNDFFNRLRMFKQSCNENFFAPLVAVSAIEANIRIGNRYLELLNKEREKFSVATIEEKYGFLHDQSISDATGKTFQLAELLHERTAGDKRAPAEIVEVTVKQQETSSRPKAPKKPRSKLFAVNKWLLAATILTVFACVGIFVWAETESKEIKTSPNVKKVNLESSEFKDFIQTARIDNDTFFGVTTSAWESLNSERKEEMLKKLLSVGTEKNYKKVHLVNNGGKAVGYSSAEKTEIYNQ